MRLCHPAACLALICHAPCKITMPTHGRSPRIPRHFSHSRSIVYARFDGVSATVEHPLHVDVDLPPQRKAIYALLRTHVPKDWCHHGEPLTIELSCFWRISFRYHLR
jgi:hypothetical protein